MFRRERLGPMLAIGFSFAAALVLKAGPLPAAWLAVPDAAITLALGLALFPVVDRRLMLGVVAAAGLTLIVWPAASARLYPVLLNLLVAHGFGRSLAPGAIPLITRIALIARRERELVPELDRYTRRSTQAWTLLFLILGLNSLVLALFASVEVVMWFANVINFWLIAAFFMLEAGYRRLRYGHHWHPSLPQVLAALARHGWLAPPRPAAEAEASSPHAECR